MKATQSQINVANRLLAFNEVNGRLELVNGKVTGTGVLATAVTECSSITELSVMFPDYFRPFYMPTKKSYSLPPKQGQQTLF